MTHIDTIDPQQLRIFKYNVLFPDKFLIFGAGMKYFFWFALILFKWLHLNIKIKDR